LHIIEARKECVAKGTLLDARCPEGKGVSPYIVMEKIINAENLNVDSTLEEISNELKSTDTLILDVGNNYFNQTDKIYDTLVMRGYDVRKTFKNGRNQIIVVNKK